MNGNNVCNGADPTVNTWHVTVITQDFSTKQFTVYHDGTLMGSNSSAMVNNADGLYPGNLEYCNFFQYGNQSTFCRVGTIMLVPRIITPTEVTDVTSSCLTYWQSRFV